MRILLALLLAVALLALLAPAAHAASVGPAPRRALKQVGDPFTRWGQGGTIDDGARSYGSTYSQIVSVLVERG